MSSSPLIDQVVVPNDGKTRLRVLSNSELRVFRACQRRHHYAYRLLRRPRVDHEALRFGSLWHVGQEAWWKTNGSPAERLAWAIAAMRASDTVDPYALVMAEELMVAYTARWGDSDLCAVAVEEPFEVSLFNPATGQPSRTFRLGGKVDAIVADERHRLFVLEHKTTASDIEVGSSYWSKVRALDTQVSTYVSAAIASGHNVIGCIYDVVRKPGLKPLKATPVESRKYTQKGFLYANQREADETPEQYRARLREDILDRPERYFARGEIVRLESEERDHAFDVWQLSRLMREAELAGFAPKNADACNMFGQCPYLRVCEGQVSINDDAFFRTASTTHEELSNE